MLSTLLIAAAFITLAWAAPASIPIVSLKYAKYQGAYDTTNNVTGYYGIRYAAAPAGQLRWQPPIDIEKRNNYSASSLINATTYGPQCLQGYTISSPPPATLPPSSEDCLLLDVVVPSKPKSDKLPVMVQIHGGGYVQGNSQSSAGNILTGRSKGSIIYVALQYRLGGLGFLSSSAVKSDGTPNAGLLDQRSAIDWVQRNIASFGGDPCKVTIIGGSAGGGSVSAQLQLYGGVSNSPFRAAIPEFPWWQPFHTDDILETQYKLLLSATGCSNLPCLRSLDYSTLSNAIQSTYISGYAEKQYGYGDFYYGPTVDKHIIRELPSLAFPAGRYSKVPMLVDHDALEGEIFTNYSITTNAEVVADLHQLWPKAGSQFFAGLDKYYPLSDFGTSFLQSPIIQALISNPIISATLASLGVNETALSTDSAYFRLATIFGDAFVVCGTRTMAKSLVHDNVPVWKLVYDSGILIHGAVILDVLGNNVGGLDDGPVTNPNQRPNIMDYYLSFATELDPNKGLFSGVPRSYWPRYGKNQTTMVVNFTDFTVVRDPDDGQRCDFMQHSGRVILN